MIAKHAVHAFEVSGLGRAPFEFVALVRDGDPLDRNLARMVGATLGRCQHCGRKLEHNCLIRDRDGRCSVVGTGCVRLCGDEGMARDLGTAEAERRALATHARRQAEECERQARMAIATQRRKADHAARTAGLAERNAWLLDLLADERDRGSAEHLGRLLRNFSRRELNTAQRDVLQRLYAARHGDPGSEPYRTSALAFRARWELED